MKPDDIMNIMAVGGVIIALLMFLYFLLKD